MTAKSAWGAPGRFPACLTTGGGCRRATRAVNGGLMGFLEKVMKRQNHPHGRDREGGVR